YPKNMLVKGKKSLLTVKWICPIHAEPIHYGISRLSFLAAVCLNTDIICFKRIRITVISRSIIL
ncbi:MAG: hypothetical protein JW837_13350, partial [Sedimentisphaerales bacterium]|nr:hypothetical protein [Sedimentisphaerales bacterium]